MTEKIDSNNSKQQYDRFTENTNAQYKLVGVTPLVIRCITPFMWSGTAEPQWSYPFYI